MELWRDRHPSVDAFPAMYAGAAEVAIVFPHGVVLLLLVLFPVSSRVKESKSRAAVLPVTKIGCGTA
jgi:hypothetical protein